MLRRIAIVSLMLAVLACAAGAWATVRHATTVFIAPGAADVQVSEIGLGERVITYRMANADDTWQTPVVLRLTASGWRVEADKYQWGGTDRTNVLATYIRTSGFWFLRIHERAELLGDRTTAMINVSYHISYSK
jgi:hypothetical protein